MIIGGILKGIQEGAAIAQGNVKISGKVVLVKRNVLDFNDFGASVIDRVSEVLGQGVEFQLISSTVPDKYKRDNRGVTAQPSKLENWLTTLSPLVPGDSVYNVTFFWDPKNGVPGAVYVKNLHPFEFFLKTITLENVPGKGTVHFPCYSWVYPAQKYRYTRIFFTNDTYVSGKIPPPLLPYVEEELYNLRGDNEKAELQEHDRVYGYAVYNDLGNDRPILGGNPDLPYPRRGRTSREPDRTNPKYESRMLLSQVRLDGYVPRDEKFGHLKMSDFLGYALKALLQSFVPILETYVDWTPKEFDTFQDVMDLYEGGIKLPQIKAVDDLKELIPFQLIKEVARSDGENLLRMPLPLIIKSDKEAWRTDEEFGREMVAGVNPVIIARVKEFPPTSTLDPSKYGSQTSTVTEEHIERSYLEGLSACDAVADKRLFMLNHHDALLPYLNRINSDKTGNKIYATRTFAFLRSDSTLKPVAIELSLPDPRGEQFGAVSKVFTPPPEGTTSGLDYHIWQLAKAYAAVNDSGVHQLISHWLNTHCVIEPFILATHRHLSALHPIHKLLTPHYRDTMNINMQARQSLICSGGLLEKTVFPGQYAMQMSAVVYKSWNLLEQAPPQDLIKRGVAEPDATKPHGVRLLIDDYPYAVDGLDIWGAIVKWVKEYCAIYYPDDASVKTDAQIQAWWKEAREVGHGDKKDEPWWPKMDTVADLVQSCSIIIWIGSALHAAVNFGQYPYAGYLPNRPTISRRFMPEPGTAEYAELEKDPDRAFLRTITSQLQTIIGVSLIEVLSRHPSDEVYLGTRSDGAEWTSDQAAIQAFERFGKELEQIERKIKARNADPALKNRNGPAKAPYTLLYPGLSDPSEALGLTGLGIPNSISI